MSDEGGPDVLFPGHSFPFEGLPSLEESPDPEPEAWPIPRPRSLHRPSARRRSMPRSSRPWLPAEPAIFPWLSRHLAEGEATIWWGAPSAVEPLLELLYVGNALARGTVSLIEGANRFHPYRLGEVGRSLGVTPEEVLSRVRIARAFTAHQLVALVDAWSSEARRARPTLLIAHELPALFETEEVTQEERRALLLHVARTLGQTLRAYRSPLLLVLKEGFERFPGLLDEGPPFADIVTLRRRPSGLSLRSYRDAGRAELVRRTDGQRGMEEFDPVREATAQAALEVIPWAARYRPTAKRWTSG